MDVDEHCLESLILDNDVFEKLSAELDVFCPFDAVGMDRQEIRHAYFLRYILDPQRPHGFGAECLRGFMWAAATVLRDNEESPIRPLDVHLMDLDSAIVEREYRSIDLVIQIPAEQVVLAVELKIDAGEHSGQLGRYRTVIEKDFPTKAGWRQIFLFLTKRGDNPSDDGRGWQSMPLESVADMLARIVDRGNGQTEARMMLAAYVAMLRRNHLTDDRMEDLARSLWREHREALEFLMSRRPDTVFDMLARILDEQPAIAEKLSTASGLKIVPDHSIKSTVRFAIESWDAVPGMLTGTGWKPSNRMLLLEVFRDAKGLRCQFELGPGEQAPREALFASFQKAGAEVGGNWALSPKWRQLSATTLLSLKEAAEGELDLSQVIGRAEEFVRLQASKYDAAAKNLTAGSNDGIPSN